ncbi:hypothetical protein PPYR_12093 [Photinus pyralis]|uniref:RNA (guanine-9-)-methyltransferase domain-containing protein 1 n=1 Tax=Photinus pyralis TaxID=7054 RepID=A0A5N4AD59_PHOPY|nr:mitochondrial ribonuclease P protein 1 homolog [Photinus pyralis]XP_031351886.1 mitochondrial ribonuclease P protein 1 homolog [Photinus pyralis]XP_031351887.1 mitochondrial ribonuclease P protein 1 homolog [Photinus pyralis]XP_031351889.1 mitochondrial ribonuclease P protein 1 homolog [Photinus pyralis]KAB0795254.1 hypothetical protein PPYR_12093 [Photinus pyralis]
MFRILRCCRLGVNLIDSVIKDSSCKPLKYRQIPNFTFKIKNYTNSVTVTPSLEAENSDEPNVSEIVGDDEELAHKLRVLILEAEVFRQEGKGVPDNSSIKNEQWKYLLTLPSISARRKYLEFLYKVEKKKENRQRKKEDKRIEWEASEKPKRDREDVMNYNLGGNHFMLRIYDTTMNQMYNNRLIQAMQFGQKMVVDCGFGQNMTPRENANCAKQLMLLFAENRGSDDPFDLHYCNTVRNSSLMNGLNKFITTMYEPWFPLHLHEESYLDVFPKEQLVYLTPHCKDVLKTYSHDDIYIIGGIVDKVNNEPLSLAKAKKEGLRMAKLPLDYYLDWGSGSGKSLTINQVLSILVDVKATGDWKHALRHVPRRKLANYFEEVAPRKLFNVAQGNYPDKPKHKFNKDYKYSKDFDNLKYLSRVSNIKRYK